MVCTASTTSHTPLSRTADYKHETRQASACSMVRSHGKLAKIDDFLQRFTEAEVVSKVQLVDKRQGHSSWTTADEQTKGDNSLTAANHRVLWHAGSLTAEKKKKKRWIFEAWDKISTSASNIERQKGKAIFCAMLQFLEEHNMLHARLSPWKWLHLFLLWPTFTQIQEYLCNRTGASAVLKSQNIAVSSCIAQTPYLAHR